MLIIRTLKDAEFSQLIQTLKDENWYVEPLHLNSLYVEFKDDFFVALLDNKIIGFIQALKYTDYFAFINNFIIKQEFRSRGFGKELFSYALSYLNKRQIALECDAFTKSFYQNYGFDAYYELINYYYELEDDISLNSNYQILQSPDIKALYNFNKNILENKYANYLISIILNDKSLFRVIYDKEKISSYALSTAYKDGYKFSIFSHNNEESLALFLNLAKSYKQKTKIYIVVSPLESSLLNIVRVLEMKESSRITRMYNKVL